jgi:hypothetical protein
MNLRDPRTRILGQHAYQKYECNQPLSNTIVGTAMTG